MLWTTWASYGCFSPETQKTKTRWATANTYTHCSTIVLKALDKKGSENAHFPCCIRCRVAVHVQPAITLHAMCNARTPTGNW